MTCVHQRERLFSCGFCSIFATDLFVWLSKLLIFVVKHWSFALCNQRLLFRRFDFCYSFNMSPMLVQTIPVLFNLRAAKAINMLSNFCFVYNSLRKLRDAIDTHVPWRNEWPKISIGMYSTKSNSNFLGSFQIWKAIWWIIAELRQEKIKRKLIFSEETCLRILLWHPLHLCGLFQAG